MFTRQAGAAFEQPPGARQGEAWSHRIPESATGLTVPTTADALGVGERGIGVFDEGRRRLAPHIHVGPTGCHSNPHAFGGFEDSVVVMGRPEIENRRRSTGEKFGDAEFGGGCDPIAVEGRLVGQGSPFEPVEEFHAVRLMTEQRLDDVDVTLDETREHDGPGSVEDLPGCDPAGAAWPDLGDSAIADQHIAGQPVSIALHGHDGAVADEKIEFHFRIVQGV